MTRPKRRVEGLCTFLSSMPPPYLHTFLSIRAGGESLCEAGHTWGQSWGTCVREMTRDKGRGWQSSSELWGFLSDGWIFSWKTYLSNPAQVFPSVAHPAGNWTHGSHTPPNPQTCNLYETIYLVVFQVSFICLPHQFLSFSKVIHLCIPSARQHGQHAQSVLKK